MVFFMEKESGSPSKMTVMKANTGTIKNMVKELIDGVTA